MTERLLQYIWQFQYYDSKQLTTAVGEALHIIHPGQHNTNQGPDFLEGRIKIGNTVWLGSIELHVNTSDWQKHRHQHDVNYKNVVLHVVWQHDVTDNSGVPLLVLSGRVPGLLLQQYRAWMQQPAVIPCAGEIANVAELVWTSWKERLLVERLQRKSKYVLQLLETNKGSWDETAWQLLARGFGIKINEDAFEQVARSLPLKLLAKHKNQLITLEALLLGQAGLLNGTLADEYAALLKREYTFQQAKYKFKNSSQVTVKFLRMHPASFPTLRLAQLAALLYQSGNLFSQIKEITTAKPVKKWLNIAASDYWNTHYKIGEPAPFREKTLGADMVNNLIINAVVPLLFSYGIYYNETARKEKALQLLLETAPEKNTITRNWNALDLVSRNAFDSQSFIELKTTYCNQKKCLDCSIGNAILKRSR